jgi:hypothetical protein
VRGTKKGRGKKWGIGKSGEGVGERRIGRCEKGVRIRQKGAARDERK